MLCRKHLLFVLQINTAFNTFRGLTLDKLLYIQKDKVALKLYTQEMGKLPTMFIKH